MRKFFKIMALILGCLLLLWGALRIGERIIFRNFYRCAQKEFKIPGLLNGCVPQGLSYMLEYDCFLTSCYMKNGEASRVYVVDRDGNETVSRLKKQDGADDTDHTGGVARFDRYCYVPGVSALEVFSLEDILAEQDVAVKLGSMEMLAKPSWCTVSDGYIITGTFYRDGSHETPMEQRLTTPAGDENKALAVVHRLDAELPLGIDPTPAAVFSLPEKVQGLCITDTGELALSVSWGLEAGKLLFYDLEKLQPQDTFSVDGKEIPLIHLDSGAMTRSVKAPPMGQEITCVDGRLYLISESASNKYIFGKLLHGRHVYSYDLKG